jgi:hypothetical protein
MKGTIVRDVALFPAYTLLSFFFDPEDGGDKFLRNIC